MFDFLRIFIAIWLEGLILYLVIKEQERAKLISYQMRAESLVKEKLSEIFNNPILLELDKKLKEQVDKFNEIEKDLEAFSSLM